MESLTDHVIWLNHQPSCNANSPEICQCQSEKYIASNQSPNRIRAELLSYVFIDQFVYTHFFSAHQDFKQEFPGPMLRGHSFGGHACPSWFLYSTHGFDKNVDWEELCAVFRDYLNGLLFWLESRILSPKEFVIDLMKMEIRKSFEEKHLPHLLTSTKDL